MNKAIGGFYMAKTIADRILWAVEMLAVDPSDRLLEIGCGVGSSVSFICNRLIDGTITAIDRLASLKSSGSDCCREAQFICSINRLLLIRSNIFRNVLDKICRTPVSPSDLSLSGTRNRCLSYV
jgi:cyclopropane fatty-acyl-phospholipid synthase-like methyltransferase